MAATLTAAGHQVSERVLSDGGEGSLDAFGGPNRYSTVSGPLGDPVRAGWRLEDRVAYIEMAQASGLALVGGADGNDALAADTYGTGELISNAFDAGAREIIVFVGGSATTDGGLGALRAMPLPPRMRSVDLVVATDVTTHFTDAARVFAPQKGATDAQVRMLTNRLDRLAGMYSDTYGIDVRDVPGAGAAGGLAGGLVALGARIESGFDVLAEAVHLDIAIADADLVITGEGFCDAQSFSGKVVGGVATWAARAGTPVLVIAGDTDVDPELVPSHLTIVSLTARFGLDRAMGEAVGLVGEVARTEVQRLTRLG